MPPKADGQPNLYLRTATSMRPLYADDCSTEADIQYHRIIRQEQNNFSKSHRETHVPEQCTDQAHSVIMCYYEQYRWECGDWKWGNFRRHCHAEYRMGETCGMKLVLNTNHQDGKCRLCENIDKKMRKYQKAKADYVRWRPDPARQASAAKAWEDMGELEEEIKAMTADRHARLNNVVNPRRAIASQTRIAA